MLSLPLIVSRGHVLLLLRGHLIGGWSNAPHSLSYPWPIVASLIHLRLHVVANGHLLLDPLLGTTCKMNVYNIGLYIYNSQNGSDVRNTSYGQSKITPKTALT